MMVLTRQTICKGRSSYLAPVAQSTKALAELQLIVTVFSPQVPLPIRLLQVLALQKLPVKGGGGAFKNPEDEEFTDLQNEEYEMMIAKMDLESSIHDMQLKLEKDKMEEEKNNNSFLLQFLSESERKIKQAKKD